MTTTLAPADATTMVRRQEAAAIFRAVADLIERRPDLPEPTARVDFYVSDYKCDDVPAALAAITTALPGPWQATISRSDPDAWLHLRSAAAGSSVTTGTTVDVAAPVKDACAPSGTRTITTWQPLPAVAALISDPGLLEALGAEGGTP